MRWSDFLSQISSFIYVRWFHEVFRPLSVEVWENCEVCFLYTRKSCIKCFLYTSLLVTGLVGYILFHFIFLLKLIFIFLFLFALFLSFFYYYFFKILLFVTWFHLIFILNLIFIFLIVVFILFLIKSCFQSHPSPSDFNHFYIEFSI
jgi:hypothetical protein